MRKNRVLSTAIAAAIALAVAASSYCSPYWTIYQMKQAYDRRDANAFSSHIDFPALQASVKAQWQAGLRDKLAQRLHGQFLANLGATLAANAGDPVIDQLVSPASVAQAFANTPPATEPAEPAPLGSASGTTATAAPGGGRASYRMRYRDWSTVEVQVHSDAVPLHAPRNPLWSSANTFVLRRDGLWSWQLAAIEFAPGTVP